MSTSIEVTGIEMNDLPEKTCSIERLVTQGKSIAAAKAGIKTQQRRNGVYAWPNEKFELDGTSFVMTHLFRQRLGDMTDDEANAEGFPDVETYQTIILKMHPGMTWDDEGLVWVHQFTAVTD